MLLAKLTLMRLMQIHKIGDESFIKDLPVDQKKWLADAIVHMIMADRNIATSEMNVLKEVLGFLDISEVNEIVLLVKEGRLPELPILTDIDRGNAAKMLFYVGAAAIIDNQLCAKEVEKFNLIGRKLGYDAMFCKAVIRLFHQLLTTKKNYLNLMREALSLTPVFPTN